MTKRTMTPTDLFYFKILHAVAGGSKSVKTAPAERYVKEMVSTPLIDISKSKLTTKTKRTAAKIHFNLVESGYLTRLKLREAGHHKLICTKKLNSARKTARMQEAHGLSDNNNTQLMSNFDNRFDLGASSGVFAARHLIEMLYAANGKETLFSKVILIHIGKVRIHRIMKIIRRLSRTGVITFTETKNGLLVAGGREWKKCVFKEIPVDYFYGRAHGYSEMKSIGSLVAIRDALYVTNSNNRMKDEKARFLATKDVDERSDVAKRCGFPQPQRVRRDRVAAVKNGERCDVSAAKALRIAGIQRGEKLLQSGCLQSVSDAKAGCYLDGLIKHYVGKQGAFVPSRQIALDNMRKVIGGTMEPTRFNMRAIKSILRSEIERPEFVSYNEYSPHVEMLEDVYQTLNQRFAYNVKEHKKAARQARRRPFRAFG